MATNAISADAPLQDLDEWDDFLTGRYQEGKSEVYSKGHAKPQLTELKPYYDDLSAEFFPAKIAW